MRKEGIGTRATSKVSRKDNVREYVWKWNKYEGMCHNQDIWR